MKNNLAIDHDIIHSFGRVNGRKLRENQAYLVENILPKFEIRLQAQALEDKKNLIPSNLFGSDSKTWLEIGFGYGEHIVGMAQQYPDVNLIGCETFINGVATLLKQIDDGEVKNIRILHGDARLLIDKLPDGSLERVFILFPDPWPKTKQQKKRIINTEMLQKLSRVIKKGGRLDIATDHFEYGEWIERHLAEEKSFIENKILGLSSVPDDWIPTRYQQKAAQQGRGARFFNCLRD